MILTIIGAGSVNWMSRLMRDIYLLDEADSGEIRLVDPDKEHTLAVADMLKTFNRLRGKEYEIKIIENRREALDGADFVMTTFSPGTMDAFRVDLEVPIKYGIRVPVSMTTGIPGISSAMRTLPVAYEIVEDMEGMCPGAWLLNVTNPMSLVTHAMNVAAKKVRVIGMCHEFHAFGGYILPILGLEQPDDVDTLSLLYKWLAEQGFEYTVAGINHFIWIIKASYKGVDMIPRIREFCTEYSSMCDYDYKNGRAQPPEDGDVYNSGEAKFALCRQLGYLPMAGDRHLIEFFPSMCNIRNGFGLKYNVIKTTVDARITVKRNNLDEVRKIASGEKEIDWTRSAEEMTEIIRAIITGKPMTGIVNMPNRGQIANMPEGAVVETLATIDSEGAKPKMSGELPGAVGSLCRLQADVHKLTLDAALNGDRAKLIEAMSLDPSNAGADFSELPQLAEELLRRNRKWLPRFFG